MIKVTCYGCGKDCSNCYGTWKGYPYHIGCIPAKRSVSERVEGDVGLRDASPVSLPCDVEEPC